ncbi:response regulator [Thiomicrorhabdus sp.]|uniref:response regulator n=1 Tax=Thiomicrorhabdus sp. TaxID=2039724 RepID=UPI0029C9B02F|nr:response regulator [Thiomicrorhabdus sp.]
MILEKPSVLVVDDDEKSVATLKRTLRKDFKVYTALSAEEAEEILRFEYIQVLVCDHRMPKETGGVVFNSC